MSLNTVDIALAIRVKLARVGHIELHKEQRPNLFFGAQPRTRTGRQRKYK